MDFYGRIDDGGKSRVGAKGTLASQSGYDVILESPAVLAGGATQNVDVYSLARMIASEDGSASAPTLLGLAECARNKAAKGGVSVTKLLTRSSMSGMDGTYSEQAAGKWASTRLDPNGRHVTAAQIAMLEDSDEFGGAVDFFDPHSQDGGLQNGRKLHLTSEDYITARAEEGLEWIGDVDGVDAYRFMAFAPGQKPIDYSDAMAVIEKGRNVHKLWVGGGSLAALLVALGGIWAATSQRLWRLL